MSSKEQPSSSSSGKPKPPKSPLPGEDPNLKQYVSAREEGKVQVGGDVSGNIVVGNQSVEPPAGSQTRDKWRLALKFAELGLGLIMLAFILYFIFQQYFIR